MNAWHFPLPGDVINDRVVVASVWYSDPAENDPPEVLPTGMIISLNKESPYFHISAVEIREDNAFPELWVVGDHMNIVHAVHDYEQNGGDV